MTKTIWESRMRSTVTSGRLQPLQVTPKSRLGVSGIGCTPCLRRRRLRADQAKIRRRADAERLRGGADGEFLGGDQSKLTRIDLQARTTRRLPSARARRRPAFTRSTMRPRSSCAMAAMMVKIAVPRGLSRSICSLRDTNPQCK